MHGLRKLFNRRMKQSMISLFVGLVLMANQEARADLVVLGQFNPGQGALVSAGFDSATDSVWIYGDFNADLRKYSRTGTFLSSIPRPGGAANDADITFAPVAFTLNSTLVPAGSLLFIDGESGTADIYALDKSTGAVIASLATAFGVNHVIGGAYHLGRGTFFLAADKVDSATPNTIAEINPLTGAVLNTFGTGSADYTINFGDLEVHPLTGNLMLVSSDENRLRELTPTGGFVQDLTLPAGVSSLSGIGLDHIRGEAWVSGTGGDVWRLGGIFSLDHFLCYKGKVTTGFQSQVVTLKDQFDEGPQTVTVKKPASLCNPAEKTFNGNVEPINDPNTHLLGYKIKQEALHEPVTGIIVKNQLHPDGLSVDTIKPDRLLVPTAKDLLDPVPEPDPDTHSVDHFKCYKVKVTPGTAKLPKGIQASVVDQFNNTAKLFDIKKPSRLCNPVDKNGEGIKNEAAHLMCYKAKPASGQPKHIPVKGIFVNNQFGPEQLDTIKEEEFCVPSVKIIGG